jgi:hypothetical protein
VDIESREHNISPNRSRHLLNAQHRNFSLHNIHNHLNYIEMATNSPGEIFSTPIDNNDTDGVTTPINTQKVDKPHETLNKIEVEEDVSQSTLSNTTNDTRLQKLKQLIRPNN